MATGRDDFVIAIRSAFLKKKDKQKFSLISLIVLSIVIIVLSNFNFKPIQFIKLGINEVIYRSSHIVSIPENKFREITSKFKSHMDLYESHQKELIKIKKEMGTAVPTGTNTSPVKGRDLRSGTPKEVKITEEDTAEALNDIMKQMVGAIKDALENTPPELSADLVDMGLTLTGGGALLKNIDKRFSKETGLPVHIADDPLSCVAVGTGKALDQEETFSTMLTEY